MKASRFHQKLPLLVAVVGLILFAAAYVLGSAWVQSRVHVLYDFEDLIRPRLVDVTIFFWLIYFCGAIGSFLNVVAWRLPRGQSIGGRSHCPWCTSTLRSRDNFPILGWIALRGRCRTCRLPISRRYPIVETLVAVTLTLIGITEIYCLALPGQVIHAHAGPIWAPRVTPDVIAVLTYHLVAATGLWAMALIRIDGVRLPPRMIAVIAFGTILPMLIYPTLMVVPWQAERPPGWNPDRLHFDAVMRVITALVAAAFFARVLAKGLCPSANLKLDPLGSGTARLIDLIAMLSVVALVVGWQSMPGFVVLAAAGAFVLRPLLRTIPINDAPGRSLTRRGSMEAFAFSLPICLALHVAFWRLLWQTEFWPSDRSSPGVILAAGVLALIVPVVLRDRPADASPVQPVVDEPGLDSSTSSPADESADELPDDRSDREADHGDHRGDHAPSL